MNELVKMLAEPLLWILFGDPSARRRDNAPPLTANLLRLSLLLAASVLFLIAMHFLDRPT